MNERQLLTNPKRKAETTFMLQFLQSINMTETVKTLQIQSQHKLSTNQKINQLLLDNKLNKEEQKQMIKQVLEIQFKKLIKNNQTSQAIALLKGDMSKYIDNVDIYSTYFLQIPSIQQPYLNKLFLTYFSQIKSITIPSNRVIKGNFDKQIWFLKSNGKEVIAIDKLANAILFRKNLIIAEKDEIHINFVTGVKWADFQMFGTSGADNKIKLWNRKIECLRVISTHQKSINCFAFSPAFIYSASHQNFILVSSKDGQQQSLKIKSYTVVDMHYLYSRSALLTVVRHKKKSQINFYKNRKKIENEFIIEKSIVNYVEISQCENYLYVNCQGNQIHVWNIKSKVVVRKYQGFIQDSCMMRMSIGEQKLAVPSINGQVIFYHLLKCESIGKITINSKTSVNCVVWLSQNQLMVGCDNGNIEQWSSQKRQEQIFQKGNLLMQMFKNIIPQHIYLNQS